MSLAKALIIGAAGFAAYEVYSMYANSANPPATAAPTNALLAVVKTISPAQLESLAGGVGKLNVDQWNYYFSKLTNQPGPSIVNSGQLIDVNTYYNALLAVANGQATGLGRLGMVIDLKRMYAGRVAASGVGADEFDVKQALAGALGIIVNDPNNSAAYIDESGMVEAASFAGSQNSTTTDFYLAAQGKGA